MQNQTASKSTAELCTPRIRFGQRNGVRTFDAPSSRGTGSFTTRNLMMQGRPQPLLQEGLPVAGPLKLVVSIPLGEGTTAVSSVR
jgi:hypothetical protein